MKKLILIICLLIGGYSFGQEIKLIAAYLKGDDMATRYVAVKSDNSIHWFAPGNGWKASSNEGLPSGYQVKFIDAYSYTDGSTRYVVVLEDNSIWWFAPGNPWKKSSIDGLPSGYKVKGFEAYSKDDGTRYVALLSDNSIWWFAPGNAWQKSDMTGL